MNAFSSLRWPSLSGDNWWRGHAAAFLKYVNLPSEALRHGRVCQVKFMSWYFLILTAVKKLFGHGLLFWIVFVSPN
jgi:hypothetical protein